MGRQADTTLRAAARRAVPVPARIDPSAPGQLIPLDFNGLSFETSHLARGFGTDTNLINIFKPLGASGSVRVGGAASDGATYPTDANIQSLARFVIAMGPGWSLIYGVNYQRNEPAEAARQIKLLTDILGVNRVVVAIGNEPDLYNGGSGVNFADEYRPRWQSIHDAIVALVPGARFGGPDAASAAAKSNELCRLYAVSLGSQNVGLYRHLYGAGVNQPAASNITDIWANRAAYSTATLIRQYAGAANLRARMTEGGSINGSGNFKIASTLGACLWYLETSAVLAQADFAGVNWHGGPNNNPNIPVFNGYGPIRLEADGTYRPLPTLFAMLAFKPLLGGRFVPITGKLTAECPAWGVLGADGRTRVLVVNKTMQRTAQINLTSTTALTRGASYLLTGSHWSSTRATFGGSTVGPDGSFNPVPASIVATGGVLPIVVPPSSAALVELS